MSKIVLIGANHAGIAAANTILDNYPDNEVVIIDKNTNLSYLGCGTALWVGRHIDSYEHLFYTNKEAFDEKGAKLLMETVVDFIDYNKKIVYSTNVNGEKLEETYDKLILATGSIPIKPNIQGTDLENVQFVKLFQDSQIADTSLCDDGIKEVAVIGAGYIGVEMAEAIKRRGKNVRLFDAADTCLNTYYDPWFTNYMDNVLVGNGVETHYGEVVQSFDGDKGKVTSVTTDKGTYETDLVIMAIGFSPNNSLGRGQIETFENGAYLVNLHQETSLPDVFAVGDCATLYSNALEDTTYIALASNAVRSGIVAGHNAAGVALESIGVQGLNGISIFGYNMVSTGLNLAAAKKAGYKVKYTDFEDLQKPGFIKDNDKVKIRIIYEAKTRRILGAQLASTEDISMGIHMFSLAIQEKLTIDKLKLLDIFFLPHFNQPYNYITMAALSAE